MSADDDTDSCIRALRRQRRAARRLARLLRHAVEDDLLAPEAAVALAKAQAQLALATSRALVLLALHGTERLLDRLSVEETLRTRISPEAVAAELGRRVN